MNIRLQGTNAEILELLELLRTQLGDKIERVSKPYKDRGADTYRVYITLRN